MTPVSLKEKYSFFFWFPLTAHVRLKTLKCTPTPIHCTNLKLGQGMCHALSLVTQLVWGGQAWCSLCDASRVPEIHVGS